MTTDNEAFELFKKLINYIQTNEPDKFKKEIKTNIKLLKNYFKL